MNFYKMTIYGCKERALHMYTVLLQYVKVKIHMKTKIKRIHKCLHKMKYLYVDHLHCLLQQYSLLLRPFS